MKKETYVAMSPEMAKLFKQLQGKDPAKATPTDKKRLARFKVLLKEQLESDGGQSVINE
jgi:hypothetical protein